MSISQILDRRGRLAISLIPDLRALGYTNESDRLMTSHVSNTRGRLVLLEGRSALLDLATANLQTRVTALEADGGGDLSARVAELEELISRLTARLAYAEAYLQMIDEAIAVDGFSGWAPPAP